MDLRTRIRRIVSEIFEMEAVEDSNGNERALAKEALIALSEEEIPEQDIKYFFGTLDGADFEEEGYSGSSGELEIIWNYKGTEYGIFPNVETEFYITPGTSGSWDEAPYGDEFDRESVVITDDKLKVWVDGQDEYEFADDEFDIKIRKILEQMLLGYYDPGDQEIGYKKN